MRLLRQTSLPISLYELVHDLGQRYILYNRRANTSGVYSPNLAEYEFCALRLLGLLRSSPQMPQIKGVELPAEVGAQKVVQTLVVGCEKPL